MPDDIGRPDLEPVEEGALRIFQSLLDLSYMTPDELNLEVAEKLFATPQSGRELGVNPDSGRTIVAREGRFGPYVTEQLGEDEEAKAAAKAEATELLERTPYISAVLGGQP